MKNKTNRRPSPNEYGAYYDTYISKVEQDDFLQALAEGKAATAAFFRSLPEEKWDHRYAPGKWSVKELLQHLIDAERVFSYRALRIARNDMTPLPGFDENEYAPASKAALRSPSSLLAEYEAVREATIHLFMHLDGEALSRIGTASNHPVSPLAAAFIIAGHELHHVGVIKERYL